MYPDTFHAPRDKDVTSQTSGTGVRSGRCRLMHTLMDKLVEPRGILSCLPSLHAISLLSVHHTHLHTTTRTARKMSNATIVDVVSDKTKVIIVGAGRYLIIDQGRERF